MFELISTALFFTNQTPAAQLDKFYPVCNLLEAWNNNMVQVFSLGAIVSFNENMSK